MQWTGFLSFQSPNRQRNDDAQCRWASGHPSWNSSDVDFARPRFSRSRASQPRSALQLLCSQMVVESSQVSGSRLREPAHAKWDAGTRFPGIQ